MKKTKQTQRNSEIFDVTSWLARARTGRSFPATTAAARMVLFGDGQEKAFAARVKKEAFRWQPKDMARKDLVYVSNGKGPVWMIRQRQAPMRVSHQGLLEESPYTYFRDTVGSMIGSVKASGQKVLAVEFVGMSDAQILGALIGLELAAYQFKDHLKGRVLAGLPRLQLVCKDIKGLTSVLEKARLIGVAVNRARHWVNLPPNLLHPETFAAYFAGLPKSKHFSVEVWDERRLEKEKMNLHLAVGSGSEHAPRLVRLRWRPPGSERRKPIALVGKGVTFDTGGLDIKPSSGMRLMKKDMGGAAAVLAAGLWAAEAGLGVPLDVYVALAENAVDGKSFLPSDVIRARSGMDIEIDNTDAEGRLVLADALDVAVTEETPECVVDLATLTGAIKVGLGVDMAGLFANDDTLAMELSQAGQRMGDLNWRMPLYDRYWAGMISHFADCKNSGESFGGAITAALFLSRFVRGNRWAHLDIYAWNDKPAGALGAVGGSGQGVPCLIEWLSGLV